MVFQHKKVRELQQAIKDGADKFKVATLTIELSKLAKQTQKQVDKSKAAVAAALRAQVDKANNAVKKAKADLAAAIMEHQHLKTKLMIATARLKGAEGDEVAMANALDAFKKVQDKITANTNLRKALAVKLEETTGKLYKADQDALKKAKEQGTWAPLGTEWREWKRGFAKSLNEKWEATKLWPTQLANMATEAWNQGIKDIKDSWNSIKTKVTNTWTLAKNKAGKFFDDLGTKISASWNTAKKNITDTYATMKTKVSKAYDSIETQITNAYDEYEIKFLFIRVLFVK